MSLTTEPASEVTELSEESDLPEASSETSSLSHEDPPSLSETFQWLNGAFSHDETHIHHLLKSEKSKAVDANQKITVQQQRNHITSQESIQKTFSSVAIDIPPCLIAAIWTVAIILCLQVHRMDCCNA